jgi:hypothetical protein
MRAGREMDREIAQSVMGRVVTQQKREVFESTDKGTRPLANYTTDITAAWEVAEHMAITLVPIQEKSWFALVGRGKRWASPAEFIKFLGREDFLNAGAAVGEDAALTICQAALNAIKNKETAAQTERGPEASIH